MVCFHSNRLHHLMARNKNAQNICLSYTVTVVHFTDQNWISKTVYCIRCVMVCKIGFTNWNAKIALLRASMVVTYCIKLFRTGADRHNVSCSNVSSTSSRRDKNQIIGTRNLSIPAMPGICKSGWFCKFVGVQYCLLLLVFSVNRQNSFL